MVGLIICLPRRRPNTLWENTWYAVSLSLLLPGTDAALGFTNHIFPPDTIPFLTLVANIGLCLFLFLVGLEIDASVIRRNARLSVTVALAGMVIPFGFGAALSIPIYKQFIDPSVKFTYFMLFTGYAHFTSGS